MTENTEPRRRRGWLIAAAIVVVLGVGGWAASGALSSDPEPTSEPTSPTSSASTPPAEPEYVVEAGGGGTAVASIDGITPVGYPQSCEGAVAAATNMYLTLDALPDGWWTPEQVARHSELVEFFSPGEIEGINWMSSTKQERAEAAAAVQEAGVSYWADSYDAAVGAFRVVSCTDAEVIVDVVYGSVLHGLGGADLPTLTSSRVTVAWLGDWSVRDISPLPAGENPVVPTPDGFSPETRRDLIDAGGPGWTEYSNARP